MPKTTVNWSVVDGARLAELPPPALAFEPEVGKETARVQSIVTSNDVSRSKLSVKLLEFASNSHPEDYYIRNMAMLAVFEQCGVLDGYFNAVDHNAYMARFLLTDYGWTIQLRRPNHTGLFNVAYIEDVNTHEGRQTVRYTATQ